MSKTNHSSDWLISKQSYLTQIRNFLLWQSMPDKICLELVEILGLPLGLPVALTNFREFFSIFNDVTCKN